MPIRTESGGTVKKLQIVIGNPASEERSYVGYDDLSHVMSYSLSKAFSMAEARRFACGSCSFSVTAWSDGNPYYLDETGEKQYAYHPVRSKN
jgi:hypothetical protein